MPRADIYWVEVPYGRLAILGRPRSQEWLGEEIQDWSQAGLTEVVCLLEDSELRELGLEQEGALVAAAGMRWVRFPIADHGVPASAQAARQLWEGMAESLRAGGCIGVHCRASIGRAGLIVAGTLVQLGVAEELAWAHTSRARRREVPDTPDQRAWLSEVRRTAVQPPR